MTPFGSEGWGDVFFDRLWPEWGRDMGEEWSPSMDFSEKDGVYTLRAELPGMDKDDISVSVHDGLLSLSGKKESTKEEKDTNFYLKEMRHGSFCRSFRLAHDVEMDKVDAVFKDGVLTVTIPHKGETEAKKISIH